MSTITIPKALKKQLKKQAQEEGVSMSQVATEYIESGLNGAYKTCCICEKKIK